MCPEEPTSSQVPGHERREFLKKLGLAGAGLFLGGKVFAQKPDLVKPFTVPRRKFGRHDLTVSSLCLGGHALRNASDDEAQRIVDDALALGVNFFDNAWDYHGGRAEELMGRCIKGKRDNIFLMTKVCTHDNGGRKQAMAMIDQSLTRLGTDHLDLWQVHAVSTMQQVEHAFAPGGVIEALDEARRQGKVRFVGFTGHTDPRVHLAMLSHGYQFDTCQLPISAIEANSNAFVKRVLPELVKQKIAPLGMKSLGGNAAAVRDGIVSVPEALAYALSHPVAAMVSGMESSTQLRENATIAATFAPLSPAAMLALENRCLPATESNKYQPYRKWMSYRDGDASKYGSYV
jgi:aryl-alcohol dehydrogenase-like predicted oxidoreductase